MIQALKNKIFATFNNGDKLSRKIYKNIILSFGVKGGSIIIGLLLVPMTISYINSIEYGIWITISSVVSWMSFFDIGLGNGLRNKLTNVVVAKDFEKAKIYISTTYATLMIIASVLFIFLYFLNPIIDWRHFLNIPDSVKEDIQMILLIVVGSFCIQFIVQIINTVLTAVHEPAIAGLIAFFGQLVLLITVFFLKIFVPASLTILVLVLTFVPIFIFIIASIFLYNSKLSEIKPGIKYVDFKYIKDILQVGGIFFIIQIGALVLFQTSNIIISKVLGPKSVTTFNVAYKLFSVVTMIFVIIMTPYWSAFTEAYAKRDYEWLKSSMNRLIKIWTIISLIIVPVIVLLSKFLFNIWVGNKVIIPMNLSISMGFFVISYTCLSLNCFFLNGVGKLKIQLILYIVVCIFNIPTSFYLGRHYGLIGIVWADIIFFTIMNTILWIQTNKVLNGKASGIWNS
jgi:O-antigen/teichoic acid export membrane protein